MISSLSLINFKCFKFLDLKIAPLNLLCGINGMGKSSVIQSLLILRQSFLTGDLQEGRLVLGGELADLGTGSDVLFEDAENDFMGFEIVDDTPPTKIKIIFEYSKESDQLSALPMSKKIMSKPTLGGYGFIPENWSSVPPFGGDVVYICAERIGPRKLYARSETFSRQHNLGAKGEYTLNFLIDNGSNILDRKDPRICDDNLRRLKDVVDYWLREITPGTQLEMESIPNADALVAGFKFSRPGDIASRRYRATNVGFGLSYVLPIIVALLSPKGTLVLIENPEAHLHPRGQTKLAELAARAAAAGVQVFAETHSDHFMDGVRLAVKNGLIKPDDTAFNYFFREGGEAITTSPEIDQDGRLSSWPPGFFDQHDENLANLIAPPRRKG